MASNFEEQFLLILVPYTQTWVHYESPSGRPDLPANVPVNPDAFPDADSWTQAVRKDIIKIANTKVGGALLRSIKYHGKIITIRPKNIDDCNAFTGEGDELTKGDQTDLVTGADILFNPATYLSGGTCEAKHLQMGGFHIESDETLLHELVHAFRRVAGVSKGRNLGKGLSFYGDSEEFDAVLVQGIYASERKKPIRSSHFKHFEMDKELSTSLKFFRSGTETFTWVETFCKENHGFTQALAELNLAFNPINSYYYDREQARQLSRSAFAQNRDKSMPMAKALVDFLKKELN